MANHKDRWTSEAPFLLFFSVKHTVAVSIASSQSAMFAYSELPFGLKVLRDFPFGI